MEKQRIAAYASAHSEIESLAATVFVLKVQRFLARHDWREVSAGSNQQNCRAVRKFSKAALNRLRARVLKRGKAASVSDEARHKLRIALKNLRYGVDFFAICLATPSEGGPIKKRLSALQDLLGIRNDIVGANKYLKELRAEIEPEAERIVEFIQGWYARDAAVADKAISKSWKKFKRTEHFLELIHNAIARGVFKFDENVPVKLNFLNCYSASGIAYLRSVRTCFASDAGLDRSTGN